MEDVGMFYGLLVYFKAIWFILRIIVVFYGTLVIFYRFGMLHLENYGNPSDIVRRSGFESRNGVRSTWQCCSEFLMCIIVRFMIRNNDIGTEKRN
jgi:hypothetical protein